MRALTPTWVIWCKVIQAIDGGSIGEASQLKYNIFFDFELN